MWLAAVIQIGLLAWFRLEMDTTCGRTAVAIKFFFALFFSSLFFVCGLQPASADASADAPLGYEERRKDQGPRQRGLSTSHNGERWVETSILVVQKHARVSHARRHIHTHLVTTTDEGA